MPISGKKVIKILKKSGWKSISQTGSHVKLKKGTKITHVPVHGNKGLIKEKESLEIFFYNFNWMKDELSITIQQVQKLETPGKSNPTIKTLQKISNALSVDLEIKMVG
jgi:predicted RNA binding protein YcfA (HicA-like mRNA interferase family)